MTVPEPSWEIFAACKTCNTPAKQPCWNLSKSTTKNWVRASMPHRGRKRLK